MKILNQIGHQGDTQWYSIDEIPENAKKVEKQFIAESERSGNVHALSGNYDMYEVEEGFVIDCKEECVLNHTGNAELTGNWNKPVTLPERDHRSSKIPKGKFFVGIQNRFDPLANMKKRVID